MAGPRAAAGEGIADAPPAITPEIVAEAAVWVARLHGPDRSRNMERECLAWQARSAAHREAFERCTETWQDVPNVSLASAYATASARPAPPDVRADDARRTGPMRWAAVLAVALVLVGGAALFQKWRGAGEYNTGVGEQQLVVLDDGTRMSLNTATRVRVDLGSAQRTVNVDTGEALFEVAKDARRPFVVRVAGAEVVAADTVVAVRFTTGGARANAGLAVTLISGQATVRAGSGGSANGLGPDRAIVMHPGERVHLAKASGDAAQVARVDRPNIEQIVAWKRSEAVFDGASLADAVAEMNRYSRTPIVLFDDPALAGLRVSGLYRTGDNAGFARAVAALHRLSVSERQGRLELAKAQ